MWPPGVIKCNVGWDFDLGQNHLKNKSPTHLPNVKKQLAFSYLQAIKYVVKYMSLVYDMQVTSKKVRKGLRTNIPQLGWNSWNLWLGGDNWSLTVGKSLKPDHSRSRQQVGADPWEARCLPYGCEVDSLRGAGDNRTAWTEKFELRRTASNSNKLEQRGNNC